jgi:hypothetical protein
MNPSAWPYRLVSSSAVVAVSVAALCAAWIGSSREAAPSTLQAQRPAADAPVRVVKAPAPAAVQQQPVGCRDCIPQRATEQRL